MFGKEERLVLVGELEELVVAAYIASYQEVHGVKPERWSDAVLKGTVKRAFQAAVHRVEGRGPKSLRTTFKRFIVRDVFGRRGEKGGFRGDMALFCDADAALYGLTLLTKRPDVASLFVEKPYAFLDEVANLSFVLGGTKGQTYCSRHPTYGRVFIDRLAMPLKEREDGKPYAGRFVSGVEGKGLLQRRLAAMEGRGEFPDDPVLGSGVFEGKEDKP